MNDTPAFSHENRSDGTDVWLTPPEVLAALGRFDLDPCAAPLPRPWSTATNHFVEADDGLLQPWAGRVWLNPPYKYAEAWLRKMAEHRHGIALVFARVETKAWQDFVFPVASAVLFLRGRLRFLKPDGSYPVNAAGAPSALIAYGEPDRAALSLSAISVGT